MCKALLNGVLVFRIKKSWVSMFDVGACVCVRAISLSLLCPAVTAEALVLSLLIAASHSQRSERVSVTWGPVGHRYHLAIRLY